MKTIEVLGKTYTITKLLLGDRRDLITIKDDPVKLQATFILKCVTEPKFSSIEEVYNLPLDEADILYAQITEYSNEKINDFLLQSQKSSKPESLPLLQT